MSTKLRARSLAGAALILAVVVTAAVLLVPSFALGLARLVADLWVTVMGAIAGLLGGIFGG
jgi:hypothetical protein